jgi:ABC-type transport system substrate-binding protein
MTLRSQLLMGVGLALMCASGEAAAKFTCPKKGGDLVFAGEAKVNSLDQHTSTTISTRNNTMNMLEALMTRDENNNPIPDLADTVEESADKLTYTFKLRQGVTFTNGEKFNADAVVAAITDTIVQASSSSGVYGWSWIPTSSRPACSVACASATTRPGAAALGVRNEPKTRSWP